MGVRDVGYWWLGATIWAQDEQSSGLWYATSSHQSGIASENIDIDMMGRRILVEMMPQAVT